MKQVFNTDEFPPYYASFGYAHKPRRQWWRKKPLELCRTILLYIKNPKLWRLILIYLMLPIATGIIVNKLNQKNETASAPKVEEPIPIPKLPEDDVTDYGDDSGSPFWNIKYYEN
jgi:hypothetical protein